MAVEPAVIASLIAAIAGLLTALLTMYRQQKLAEKQTTDAENLESLKLQWQEKERRDERERDAQAELDIFTEPLLEATKDIFSRIRNIRELGFLVAYLNSPDEQRSRIAELSTLYRFGKYWGTVESLYGSVSLLHLQRNKATADVAKYLDKIGWIFANDYEYGHQLMVWREEQRAIAELMKADAGDQHVIGFATFVERFPSTFATWFASLKRDLQNDGIEENQRLADLQVLAGELTAVLEERRTQSLESQA
jgi:hypothetical protein